MNTHIGRCLPNKMFHILAAAIIINFMTKHKIQIVVERYFNFYTFFFNVFFLLSRWTHSMVGYRSICIGSYQCNLVAANIIVNYLLYPFSLRLLKSKRILRALIFKISHIFFSFSSSYNIYFGQPLCTLGMVTNNIRL